MSDSEGRIIEHLGFELPEDNHLEQARRAALIHGLEGSTKPPPILSYTSAGLVLIIGPEPSALLAAR